MSTTSWHRCATNITADTQCGPVPELVWPSISGRVRAHDLAQAVWGNLSQATEMSQATKFDQATIMVRTNKNYVAWTQFDARPFLKMWPSSQSAPGHTSGFRQQIIGSEAKSRDKPVLELPLSSTACCQAC